MINPATGRAVKSSGRIGRRLKRHKGKRGRRGSVGTNLQKMMGRRKRARTD